MSHPELQTPEATHAPDSKGEVIASKANIFNPQQYAVDSDKDYWRKLIEDNAIRTVRKDDPFGAEVANMLSQYVSISEKAFLALRETHPRQQEHVIQLPDLEAIMEEEFTDLWRHSMTLTSERIYSLNIAGKTPVLADDVDILAQYQIDIAFIKTKLHGINYTCYAIRRLEYDVINAAAVSLSAYSQMTDAQMNTRIGQVTAHSIAIIKGGGVFDEALDAALLFGCMHRTFAASIR